MPARILNNRISLDIPDDDMRAIDAALQVLHDRLEPHLVALGPTDRRTLARMGAKSVEFVAKSLDCARGNPGLMPRFLDVEEFARDFDAVAQLRRLQQSLARLHGLVDDTALLSGSEAYAAALSCYNSVKAAARARQPGAALLAEDLSASFPSRQPRSARHRAGARGDAPRA